MKRDFYDKYRNNLHNNDHFDNEIKSDFHLIFSLVKELLIFLILLIPYLLAAIFYMFGKEKYKSREYFSKIINEPFKLISQIIHWFFQARYTALIILFMFFMFFIEIFFLQGSLNSLMVHPNHFSQGNYYSILTSLFLHADIIHLLSNSLALLIFGRIVERQFGWKVMGIFLISGLIANEVSNLILLFFYPNDLYYSLGASGAIAGLIIFAIMIEPFALTSVFLIPIPIFIVGWLIIGLDIVGLTNPSNVNHFAHLGGYSALLFLFFFLEFRNRERIIRGFLLNLAILVIFYFIWKSYGIEIPSLKVFTG